MGVHQYESRAEAEKDETKKFVKVERVRTKKGDGVWCRLVAQELGYGERPDELSLGSVRVTVTHAMKKDTQRFIFMDVRCAFLHGEIQRLVYMKLPHVDPRCGDGTMDGTRDVPQIWPEVVRSTLDRLG